MTNTTTNTTTTTTTTSLDRSAARREYYSRLHRLAEREGSLLATIEQLEEHLAERRAALEKVRTELATLEAEFGRH